MTLTGTSGRNGSDLNMTFSQAVPGMGDGTIRMRVKATRTGRLPRLIGRRCDRAGMFMD